ncbi:MAG: Type 1 glutamine amidotransferase-like domain-containing protein [Pseudonocardia sp.]|nr:Type 1 glutamine amidotransferase-like domain-containing protein [Pseudonocardia sp.]
MTFYDNAWAGLLSTWRLHRLDEALREASEAGVVLTGISAGSICWHGGGTTDSSAGATTGDRRPRIPAPLERRRGLRTPSPAAPADRRRHPPARLRDRRRSRAPLPEPVSTRSSPSPRPLVPTASSGGPTAQRLLG